MCVDGFHVSWTIHTSGKGQQLQLPLVSLQQVVPAEQYNLSLQRMTPDSGKPSLVSVRAVIGVCKRDTQNDLAIKYIFNYKYFFFVERSCRL